MICITYNQIQRPNLYQSFEQFVLADESLYPPLHGMLCRNKKGKNRLKTVQVVQAERQLDDFVHRVVEIHPPPLKIKQHEAKGNWW
jgi:hypothetical protein